MRLRLILHTPDHLCGPPPPLTFSRFLLLLSIDASISISISIIVDVVVIVNVVIIVNVVVIVDVVVIVSVIVISHPSKITITKPHLKSRDLLDRGVISRDFEELWLLVLVPPL